MPLTRGHRKGVRLLDAGGLCQWVSVARHGLCRDMPRAEVHRHGDDACRFTVCTGDAVRVEPACLSMLGPLRDAPTSSLEDRERSSRDASTPGRAAGISQRGDASHLRPLTRIAPLDSTVLITGVSGVGRQRITKSIHAHSRRKVRPYVAINCGVLSETLLDSELFCHGRGAFTGASQERAGLFEAANGGRSSWTRLARCRSTCR